MRRGLINRLLGAPWVSHATNKKIVQSTKAAIAPDRIESVLGGILLVEELQCPYMFMPSIDNIHIIANKPIKNNRNSVWPNGGRHRKAASREENTKLRTRMAAKIALLSLLGDELKHVVGSETTRSGLLNLLGMLQNRQLNRRLALVIFNRVLLAVLQVDSLTKHVR